jgi:hypothetical protein
MEEKWHSYLAPMVKARFGNIPTGLLISYSLGFTDPQQWANFLADNVHYTNRH